MLSHRLTLLFMIGPALVILVLFVISRLDREAIPHFSLSRFLLFYSVVVMWIFGSNYMLVSRKWDVKKWAFRSLYLGSVHTIILGFACAGAGRYWPAGAFIYFMAIMAYIGYVSFTQVFVFIGVFGISFFTTQYLEAPDILKLDLIYNLAMMFSITVALFWIGLASSFYRAQDSTIRALLRESRKDKRTILEERKKSDKLLLSILPESVAQELKETGKNHPVYFEAATVLFTDFKGFTRISEGLSPNELVWELDRCFSYFDSLMDRYNLEKLKTIGDSYMCVGGIPNSNKTHAIDCILAALEIQAFMNQMKDIKAEQNLEYWELRLGIHTGPLVAGVIGEKKFAYDVWSDTVNTASRCESSGVVGKINISGATYAIVKDMFDCEYRGKIRAKHKGEVDMYFVNQIKADLSRNQEGRVPNELFQNMYNKLV